MVTVFFWPCWLVLVNYEVILITINFNFFYIKYLFYVCPHKKFIILKYCN
jgi:hypothetical protein